MATSTSVVSSGTKPDRALGNWRWTMTAFGPHLRPPVDCHGTAASKDEAVQLVTECYAFALAAAGK